MFMFFGNILEVQATPSIGGDMTSHPPLS